MGIHRSFIKFWLHLIKNRSSHQKRSTKKAFLKPLSKIRCFLRVLRNFKKHFFYRTPPDDSFWKKYLIKTFFCCVSIVKRLLTIFVPVLIHWESCFHFCNTSKKKSWIPLRELHNALWGVTSWCEKRFEPPLHKVYIPRAWSRVSLSRATLSENTYVHCVKPVQIRNEIYTYSTVNFYYVLCEIFTWFLTWLLVYSNKFF